MSTPKPVAGENMTAAQRKRFEEFWGDEIEELVHERVGRPAPSRDDEPAAAPPVT